jgi:hypothetical protein
MASVVVRADVLGAANIRKLNNSNVSFEFFQD